MKIKILIFFVLLLGCTNSNKVPEYVIPKDDFISIIVDMHLLDGMMNESKIRQDLVANDNMNYYAEIFANYGYTRNDLDTSIYFYSLEINRYDKIYIEVLNRLNKMDTELKIEEENKKKVHSTVLKKKLKLIISGIDTDSRNGIISCRQCNYNPWRNF
ncbi:MAG: DUF4296 domain-containing protein [Bacteroidales bacterium]|jgi:hypothetical protein|nr:DUF4296 domain-containing protein [Bacteroidales bacterium]